MAVLRIEAVELHALDRHLTELSWTRLVRCDEGILVECAGEEASHAAALLARAGARTRPAERLPVPSSDLTAAVAIDLRPLGLGGIVDILCVRALASGEATSRLMTRRTARFPGARRSVDALQRVLRDEDRMFAWRRIVWARRALLRSRDLRGLRPVVFDRDAAARGDERWSLVEAAELTRWARG
jgi:hypothetical protein